VADGPIQIVLNPDRYRDQRVPGKGGGPGKDFFRGDDAGFERHRAAMVGAVDGIISAAQSRRYVNLLVKMRADALAKSHRPFGKLFRAHAASHVGTEDFGELIFSMSLENVRVLRSDIASAESTVAWLTNALGVSLYSPSTARAELSAIESIELWVPANHRGFSLDDAEAWASSGSGSSGIVVDLLNVPGKGLKAAYLQEVAPLILAADKSSVATRLAVPEELSRERDATGRPISQQRGGVLSINSDSRQNLRSSIFTFESSGAVKKIRLQDKVESDPDLTRADTSSEVEFDVVNPGTSSRPIVGVIDGGVKGPLSTSIKGASGLLPDEHLSLTNVNHASLVGGILAMGSALNPGLLPPNEDCFIYDLPMFPDSSHVANYYDDLDGFMAQLREDVQRARDASGVRVFNLSWNMRSAPGSGSYGLAARGLDQIGLELDVIFVVSAGNLPSADLRLEWPPSEADALAALALGGAPDGLSSPSESIANFAVGALNPPGLALEIEGAPTRYSRRSGRVPSAVKPDFAAIGGSAPASNADPTGLSSMDSFGKQVDVRGTSFAAPVVARYLATLDHAVAGDLSRESLIALAVHHASVPPVLMKKTLAPIAKSFVGYGSPSSVAETLDGNEHCMTLLLSDTIAPGKRVDFPFTWPASLTTAAGKSKGRVRLTLVARPQLNYAHGAEMVRLNLDAALKQADENGEFERRSKPTHEFFSGFTYANEKTLATELGKWFPIKSYGLSMPLGRGVSSDWKLEINYLTRAGEGVREQGLDFALVMSIDDPKAEAQVFNDMRLSLLRTGAVLSDLRTAVNVRTSV
jgi:hypothetical protein